MTVMLNQTTFFPLLLLGPCSYIPPLTKGQTFSLDAALLCPIACLCLCSNESARLHS